MEVCYKSAILIFAVIAYAVYRMTAKYLPRIHYNKNGKIAKIVENMKILKIPYRPTPWLMGPDMHTVWGMRLRPSSKLTPRRETFFYEDGGNSIFDWFEPKDCQKDAPILIIVHTLGGGTREPCVNNMAECAVKQGWRAVVANARGCSGAKYTSRKSFNSVDTSDVHALVAHIKEIFAPRSIFLIGFCYGGNQCARYADEEPEIDGVVCVSHTYLANEAERIVEGPFNRRLYLNLITSKVKANLKRNPFIENHNYEEAKTLAEFDEIFTSKELGYKDHIELYNDVSIPGKITKARIPLLLIASDDDPFTSAKYMPIGETCASQYGAIIRVPEGGHLGFCYGIDGKKSYSEDIAIDWFAAIDNKN